MRRNSIVDQGASDTYERLRIALFTAMLAIETILSVVYVSSTRGSDDDIAGPHIGIRRRNDNWLPRDSYRFGNYPWSLDTKLRVTFAEVCVDLFRSKAHNIRDDRIHLFRTQHNVWHRRVRGTQKDFDRNSVGGGHAANVHETRRPEFWILWQGVWRELMTFAANGFSEMSANRWINLLRTNGKQ
jgi:hypothetical protein